MTDYWFLLKLLLETFNNFIDGCNFYLFKLLFEVGFNHSIQVPESLSDFGVKVVLDVIVCPESEIKLLSWEV